MLGPPVSKHVRKSNNLAIEHNWTFVNGSFKNCTQIKFHLVFNKVLLLTNKLCVVGERAKTVENMKLSVKLTILEVMIIILKKLPWVLFRRWCRWKVYCCDRGPGHTVTDSGGGHLLGLCNVNRYLFLNKLNSNEELYISNLQPTFKT